MTDDKIKTILRNFKNDIGKSVSELDSELDNTFGIDSSSGTRLYIITNGSKTEDSNNSVVVDGEISKSYAIITLRRNKVLVPIPKIIDKKIGTYHRRFTSTREVYSSRDSL